MDVTQAPEGPVAGATSGMGETTTGGTCWSTDLLGWHGGRGQPMTVVAERAAAEKQRASDSACYEVRYPETGEVMGYLSASGGRPGDPLGAALAQNGFRLVSPAVGPGEPGRHAFGR